MKEKYAELYPDPEESDDSIVRDVISLKQHEVDMKRLRAMAKDTFLASVFLPCHHDFDKKQNPSGHKAEVVVRHPRISHVDVLCIPEIPKTSTNKHLSLHTMKTSYKPVKKVKRIRQFVRSRSVFADWQTDTKKILDEAFELDAKFLKLFKFIKDPSDLAATLKILKKNFSLLKC